MVMVDNTTILLGQNDLTQYYIDSELCDLSHIYISMKKGLYALLFLKLEVPAFE